MYKIFKPRIAILTVLAWLGIVTFPLLTDVKTLAQTQLLPSQCTNSEIHKHIQQLGTDNSSAIEALVKCRLKSVPALTKSLTNQDENIRIAAVAALGEIGSSSVLSVPALTELLKDKSEDVRIIVVDTLEKIGKPGIPALIQAVQNNDNWMVRYSAADALGRIGASNEENAFVRYEAILERIECRDVAVMDSCNILGFYVPGSGNQNSTHMVGQVTSNYVKQPPAMCRIPVLRRVFRWKCL